MLASLKNKKRLQESVFLGLVSLVCFGFSVARIIYSDSNMFLFLNWNLFLAFIPWALTSWTILRPKLKQNKKLMALVLFSWMLFFPNAPYILTDLYHLTIHSTVPIWFDLILILSFAWVGLIFGFLSLWDIERILTHTYQFSHAKKLSVALLFLAAFGIYIGRYLRWNSWDILSDPFGLIHDIGSRLMFPFHYPTTWGVTLFMGLFLNLSYWSFRYIGQRE